MFAARKIRPRDSVRCVVLISDQQLERECWQAVVNAEPGFSVSATGSTLCALRRKNKPSGDAVLLRFPLVRAGPLERNLGRRGCFVVVVSDNDDEAMLHALRCAPTGVITDRDSSAALWEALRCDQAARPYCSPRVRRALATEMCGRPTRPLKRGRLSSREFQVFRLLGSGKKISEIANILSLHRKSVALCQTQLKQKCGLTRVSELKRAAIQYDRAVNG